MEREIENGGASFSGWIEISGWRLLAYYGVLLSTVWVLDMGVLSPQSWGFSLPKSTTAVGTLWLYCYALKGIGGFVCSLSNGNLSEDIMDGDI